jgi:hypothetical protein
MSLQKTATALSNSTTFNSNENPANSNEENYKHNYHQTKTLKNGDDDITLERNFASSGRSSSGDSGRAVGTANNNSSATTSITEQLKQNGFVDSAASFDLAKSGCPLPPRSSPTSLLSATLLFFVTLYYTCLVR